MFMKINFIFVCYLIVSIKSNEPKSNTDPIESEKKTVTGINTNDKKTPAQLSPGTGSLRNLNKSTTLSQKVSSALKSNSFTPTDKKKEIRSVSTTIQTLTTTENPENPTKTKINNNLPINTEEPDKTQTENAENPKKTININALKNPENPDKTQSENTENPKKTITINAPINTEEPDKTQTENAENPKKTLNINALKNPENPDKTKTENSINNETPRKSKPNKKTTLANSENSVKSQRPNSFKSEKLKTKDQGNPSNSKPNNKTESTNSDNPEKFLTNKGFDPDDNTNEDKQKNDKSKTKLTGKLKNLEDPIQNKGYKSQNLDETSENSSSSHFMIFIFLGLLFTIVGYVAFQKRKKIMAYVIEGRKRTSRSRRVSGGKETKVAYKPLDNEDKEAGTSSYKYVY